MENQKDMKNLPPLDEPTSATESERDPNAGLTVEMTTDSTPTHPAQPATHLEINKSNEDNRGLPVETTVQASEDKTKENEPSTSEQLDNEVNETKSDNEKDSEDSTVSEAALGLIMLQDNNPTDNSLLQKYDNSSLMPVDAACQTDYCTKPGSELADNNNGMSYDSDDTVVLQQEIEDTIGETTDSHNANISAPAETQHDTGLPVETTGNNTTLDTSSLTKDLSNLTVTPVSPNKGTVVFKSYRLQHCAMDTDNETSSRLTGANTK